MEEIVIQIIGGATITVDVFVKNVMYVKKIMFGILLPVVVKTENIQQVLWMIQRLRVMKLKSYTKKNLKAIAANFNEKKATYKTQNFYILLVF